MAVRDSTVYWPTLMADFYPVVPFYIDRAVGFAVLAGGVGVAVGLVAAVAVMRLMTPLLYEVQPVGPLTYAAVAAGLIGVAALASYLGQTRFDGRSGRIAGCGVARCGAPVSAIEANPSAEGSRTIAVQNPSAERFDRLALAQALRSSIP